MKDVGKIIETILSSVDGGGAVYRDEPIISTAAQTQPLPEKYREMRRLASSDPSLLLNESKLFYKMAKFMEDFEDSFEYKGTFMRYFPTYRQMNDRQIRAYFSWRTDTRRGDVKETSLSFVFVYVYELINLIGCSSPGDALEKLRSFTEEYSKFDSSLLRYTKRWERDLAIYYGLTDALAEDGIETACGVLDRPDGAGDDELFSALTALSSYSFEKSRLFKAKPAAAKALICRIYRSFFSFCAENRRTSLSERLFGRKRECDRVMFPSAVFYNVNKEDREVRLPSGRVYRCRGGRWTESGFPEIKKKSRELGALIKTADSLIRPYFGIGAPDGGDAGSVLKRIVEKEVALYREEIRLEKAKRVEFDFSKLDSIRDAANSTMEKLVVEEETDDAAEIFDEPQPNEPVAAKEGTEDGGENSLTFAETAVLRAILSGDDAAAAAKSAGTMLSVAVDSINEKLFPVLCDTAIEFDGDIPVPIDDYIEELKGIASL